MVSDREKTGTKIVARRYLKLFCLNVFRVSNIYYNIY